MVCFSCIVCFSPEISKCFECIREIIYEIMTKGMKVQCTRQFLTWDRTSWQSASRAPSMCPGHIAMPVERGCQEVRLTWLIYDDGTRRGFKKKSWSRSAMACVELLGDTTAASRKCGQSQSFFCLTGRGLPNHFGHDSGQLDTWGKELCIL
jgi:hypothetical protein